MKTTLAYSLITVAALSTWSCKSPSIGGTSKVDVGTTQNNQVEEIERLKAELATVEGKVREMPMDRTDEIKALQAEANGQTEELQKYEAAISKLQARKMEIEKEFESYKRQYVTR
jgi:predicted nuclease with TOPRIM domain